MVGRGDHISKSLRLGSGVFMSGSRCYVVPTRDTNLCLSSRTVSEIIGSATSIKSESLVCQVDYDAHPFRE